MYTLYVYSPDTVCGHRLRLILQGEAEGLVSAALAQDHIGAGGNHQTLGEM